MQSTDTPISAISFVFNWVTVIQFAVQILLPLLVAVTTKLTTSGRMRGTLLALYTLVATILNGLAQGLLGQPVDLFAVLMTGLLGFVISVGFYFGLWGAKGPIDPDTGSPTPSISAAIIANVGAQNTASELHAAHRADEGV